MTRRENGIQLIRKPEGTTVNSVLAWAIALLGESRVPEAPLNAELLLAHVLGLPRLHLRLEARRELVKEELSIFSSFIGQRIRREPLQYIMGSAEFMGLILDVDPSVLIPRPETEVLVEAALEMLRNSPVNQPTVLDVGTGSGNIALSIKHHFPGAIVTAVDVSPEALETAMKNSRRNKIHDVAFLQADMLGEWLPGMRFNLILSNPPYVSKVDFDALDPEIRLYEPVLATTDGSDGFRFIRRLLETASDHLEPGGRLLVEVGYGQAREAVAYAGTCGLSGVRVHEDLSGVPRILSAMLPGKGP